MSSPHGPNPNTPPPQGGPNLPPIPGYGGQQLQAPNQLSPGNPWGPPKENFKPTEEARIGFNPIRGNTTGHDTISTHLHHVAEERAQDPYRLPGHEKLIAPFRKLVDLGHVMLHGTHRWGENVGQPVSARRRYVGSAVGILLMTPVAIAMSPLSGAGLLIRQKTNKNRNVANPWGTRATLRRGEGTHQAAVLPDPNNPLYPSSSQRRLQRPLQAPQPYQGQGGNQNQNQNQQQQNQNQQQQRRRQQPQQQQQQRQQPGTQPNQANPNQQQPVRPTPAQRRRGGPAGQPAQQPPPRPRRRMPVQPTQQPLPRRNQGNQANPNQPQPQTNPNQPQQPNPNASRRPTLDPSTDPDAYLEAVYDNMLDRGLAVRWYGRVRHLPPEERRQEAIRQANAFAEIERRIAEVRSQRPQPRPIELPRQDTGPSMKERFDYRQQVAAAIRAGEQLPLPSWGADRQTLDSLTLTYYRQVLEARTAGRAAPPPPEGVDPFTP